MVSHGLFQDWLWAGWKGDIKHIRAKRNFCAFINLVFDLTACHCQKEWPGFSRELVSGMSLRAKSSSMWEGQMSHSQWPRGLGVHEHEIELGAQTWVDPLHSSLLQPADVVIKRVVYISWVKEFLSPFLHSFLHCLVKDMVWPFCSLSFEMDRNNIFTNTRKKRWMYCCLCHFK